MSKEAFIALQYRRVIKKTHSSFKGILSFIMHIVQTLAFSTKTLATSSNEDGNKNVLV